MKKNIFYLILLGVLASCAVRPPSDETIKITGDIERIAKFSGQIDLRNIGSEEVPLWLASHMAGKKEVLIIGRSMIGHEVLLESLKRVINHSRYYGPVALDYIVAFSGADNSLYKFLKHKSYDLVIVLDQDEGPPGFYLQPFGGADYGSFVIARLKDKDFLIRTYPPKGAKITDGIATGRRSVPGRYLPRGLSLNIFKQVSSAGDPFDEQMGAHLIALETLLRQLAKNYTAP